MENLPKIGDHAYRLKINIIVEILWVKNERTGSKSTYAKSAEIKSPCEVFITSWPSPRLVLAALLRPCR